MSLHLSLTGIKVRRAGRLILDLHHLTLAPGEITGLVGPNGSGKTTLLKVMGLVLAPDAGDITIDGVQLHRRRSDEGKALVARRRIPMVFQSPTLLSRSVYDNIAAGLRFRGVASTQTARRTQHWLERLNLGPLAARNARDLSGGEAQRVALARALVLEPDLLLLDEPTANLDPPARSALLSELREILTETTTGAVLVTHDIEQAPYFADRLLVMRQGQLIQSGSPAQVLDRPVDAVAAAFLGFDNILPTRTLQPLGYPGAQDGLTLCIRPEHVAINQAATPAPALHHSGPVRRLLPWGPLYRVSLALPGGDDLLTGHVAAREVLEGRIAQGTMVKASFDPRDGVLLPSGQVVKDRP